MCRFYFKKSCQSEPSPKESNPKPKYLKSIRTTGQVQVKLDYPTWCRTLVLTWWNNFIVFFKTIDESFDIFSNSKFYCNRAKWKSRGTLKSTVYKNFKFFTSTSCLWEETMWYVNPSLRLKLRPQILQPNGFSPVWTLMWRWRSIFWWNSLEQKGQQCTFDPFVKWLLICMVSTSGRVPKHSRGNTNVEKKKTKHVQINRI